MGAIASTFLIPALPAIAGDCSGYENYIVMPNGKCMVLDYMNILAASREMKTQADTTLKKQFEANVILDMSDAYRLRETKEERDTRYKNLAKTSIKRDKVAGTAQQIEDKLYPIHKRALGLVRQGFAPNR